jgi:pilus assembly protein CpaE
VPCLRHTQRLIKAIEDRTAKEVKPSVIVNRFEQKKSGSGVTPSDVEELLGDHYVGGISNNYRLVREAVDRGIPLHALDPEANVLQDLKRIILPEEAEVATKKRSLFSLPLGLMKKAG